ncbi:hypothetical protein [Alicyclobacillus acidocaldarius]|uniref:Uncharacterized protein n=1 Tax=Alicyclobacillus acidocaldarius subsp. acidocaldarius (strain ATCC 27009 / DSM 446 / BCRC 14685 / JCM 5260 / KCTC 1825 / NBRC 15652 / NCIMB 11725 / NRRL B-14509 / 104-IA) TaxID=521098 RepID=C8WTB3_ALIAD|nr:hypothetical protein [Alicyclobacillus acidocaldarius]ACV59627.1 hypothetical protein Aaci_2623 [Alicyclobacillus acidocaldarius subsp. acidocaldarius DSM 446]
MRAKWFTAGCVALFLISVILVWIFAEQYVLAAYASSGVPGGQAVNPWGVWLAAAVSVGTLSAVGAAIMFVRMAWKDWRMWR